MLSLSLPLRPSSPPSPSIKVTFTNPCYVPAADWIRPVVRSQFLPPWLSLYTRWTPLREAHEELCRGMATLAARRDALRTEADAAEAGQPLLVGRKGGESVMGEARGKTEEDKTGASWGEDGSGERSSADGGGEGAGAGVSIVDESGDALGCGMKAGRGESGREGEEEVKEETKDGDRCAVAAAPPLREGEGGEEGRRGRESESMGGAVEKGD